MINGLYTAVSGLMMQEKRVSTISNNLANINTPSYKKDVPVFEQYLRKETEFPQDFIQSSTYNKTMNSGVRVAEVSSDFSQGYLKETGNKLDLALSDEKAFFAIDTPYGIRYTRSGQFTVNENNELVTQDGYNVLADIENPEPITMPNPEDGFIITSEGEILVNGASETRLGIARFEDTSVLQKNGRNLYVAIDALPEQAENPGVLQGYQEGSNVNPVNEMVRLIEAQRGFESYAKIIQTIDTINGKANDVGSLS